MTGAAPHWKRRIAVLLATVIALVLGHTDARAADDLALNHATAASSSYNATYVPGGAVDGSSLTRWSSAFTNDQWWQVDLGSVRSVDSVLLNWEAAYASSYQILTSTDGVGFSLAAEQTISQSGWQTTSFAARQARYVRVLGVTRATPYGISFWDAQVFGPADVADTTAPTAPSGYTVPAGAVTVANSAQLLSALAGSTPRDIVLLNGVYDSSSAFLNQWGHRLYAANLGGAVLKAGLILGGNYGPGSGLVRGVTFDVYDPAKTLYGSVIHVWGTGTNSKVLDVTIDGHAAVPTGIFVKQSQGFLAQRVVVRNLTSNGVRVDASAGLTTPPQLEDLDITAVSRPVPMSSNGTAEACLWLGSQSTVRRVRVRRCAWMGVWTGSAMKNSLVEHLDIDQTPTGIYLEHYTTNSVFQNIHVGPNVSHGIYCEWASPEYGGKPASVDNVIQDSTFETSLVGVYMDEGTTRTTVRRSRFVGQKWAAIGDFRGIGNSYYDNDYSGILPGAVAVSLSHVPPWDGVGRYS